MLDSILDGSRLGPGEGWFNLALPQTRYTWDSIAAQYDADQDGTITADEFGGRNPICATRSRWRQVPRSGRPRPERYSLEPSPGFIAFFMAHADANGKVTAEEFAGAVREVRYDQQGFLPSTTSGTSFSCPPRPACTAPGCSQPHR